MLLFTIYLIIVIAVPVALSAVIGYRGLPRGSHCPNCAQDTLLLAAPLLRVGQKLYGGFSLQRRWCPVCEWDGYARTDNSRFVIPALHIVPRTEQLRTLEVGGREWRVMLESWRDHGQCFGRLVFVGPSGKLWTDPLAAFAGASYNDVFTQALSLSDRLLTYRLREVISG